MDEMNTTTITDESDAWDDITLDDADDADDATDTDAGDEAPPETEEDTATGSEEQGAAPDGEAADEPAPTEDLFELKHLDSTRSVGREEVIALAQKGLDYDRVRERLATHDTLMQEHEALKATREKDREALEFLEELAAAQGVGLDALIDNTRASMIADAQGVDIKTATERVKLDREKRQVEAERTRLAAEGQTRDAGRAETERRAQEAAAFLAAYPDQRLDALPDEVWKTVSEGVPLLAAYAMHENSRLRLELQAKEKSLKNQQRSVGSRATSGQSALDDIDKYWYADDE